MTKWIGVDFDQTLRRDDGSPVPLMLGRVKKWLAQGIPVRIVTARVNEIDPPNARYPPGQHTMIMLWCIEHIGQALPIQWGKSAGMLELWDDKVVRVEADTGIRQSASFIETDSCEF